MVTPAVAARPGSPRPDERLPPSSAAIPPRSAGPARKAPGQSHQVTGTHRSTRPPGRHLGTTRRPRDIVGGAPRQSDDTRRTSDPLPALRRSPRTRPRLMGRRRLPSGGRPRRDQRSVAQPRIRTGRTAGVRAGHRRTRHIGRAALHGQVDPAGQSARPRPHAVPDIAGVHTAAGRHPATDHRGRRRPLAGPARGDCKSRHRDRLHGRLSPSRCPSP